MFSLIFPLMFSTVVQRMYKAISKAIAQLNDRTIQQTILFSVLSAIFAFVCLWMIVGFALTSTALFSIGWLEVIIDLLGGLATFAVTWMLFPGIISAVMGLFVERTARAVEARHYPHLAPAVGARPSEAIFASIRFLAKLVVLNLILLLFLFSGPIFPFVFYGVNGYLLGREYFEMISFRRMTPAQARELRQRQKGKIFIFGVLVAFLLSIPILNLLTPIVAAATMVHLFESWRHDAV